jgi:adenylate cyclase
LDDQGEPTTEELIDLGLYDPAAPEAADRLELLRYVLAEGATFEQLNESRSLGDIALDLHLRPGPRIELAEVVASSGLEWSAAQRLLQSLEFPVRPEASVTSEEAATIRLLAACMDLLGSEATIQIARVAGTAMARIADVLVGSFRLRFELPRLRGGTAYSAVVKEYSSLTEELLPMFVQTLDVLLRRQLVTVANRAWSTDAEQSAVTLPRTIGFADLVGFTSASASLTVAELAAVLASFDERVTATVHLGNGQLVKTIGDEAMFACETAVDACRIALKMVVEFAESPLPPVRVGLAAGEVLSAFGDLYGPDVNLAARLVAAAPTSGVVVSEAVRSACADEFVFEALEPLELKGFPGPVVAYRLVEGR